MWVIYALKMPYRREKKTTTATTNKCLYGNDFSFWFRWKETENKCYLSIGHFCPDQQIEWYSNEFQLKQSHCVLRWVHRSITHRSSTFFSFHWTVCTCVCVWRVSNSKRPKPTTRVTTIIHLSSLVAVIRVSWALARMLLFFSRKIPFRQQIQNQISLWLLIAQLLLSLFINAQ